MDISKGSNARRKQLALLLVATAFTCALGWLFKAHCTFDGQWSNLEFYVKGCYSDAYPFWRGRGLAEGGVPYFDTRMEYPVLTGMLIWAQALLTHGLFGGEAGDPAFLFVVTLVNAALALVVTRLLWELDLPPSRLWAWALAPPLLLYVGHNWDLLAMVLALGAFLAAERKKLVDACALAGLGAAAKLFPVLLLPLFALRRFFAGRLSEVAAMAVAAVIAWAAVNLPFVLAAPENWWEFYQFSSERTGTRAAIWDLAGHYGVFATDIPQRNLLSLLLFVAGAGAILWLGWSRYRDRLWLLATPVLLWFILSSKVYSPQFDLWVYPFVLVTARRWPPIILFLIGDAAAYFAELWFFSGEEGGWPAMPMEAILGAAGLRAAAMLWLISDTLRLGPPSWLLRGEERAAAEA